MKSRLSQGQQRLADWLESQEAERFIACGEGLPAEVCLPLADLQAMADDWQGYFAELLEELPSREPDA